MYQGVSDEPYLRQLLGLCDMGCDIGLDEIGFVRYALIHGTSYERFRARAAEQGGAGKVAGRDHGVELVFDEQVGRTAEIALATLSDRRAGAKLQQGHLFCFADGEFLAENRVGESLYLRIGFPVIN